MFPSEESGILQPAKRPASCSACLAAAIYPVASCAPSESECAILAAIWQQDNPGDDQARLGPVTANHESSLPGRQSREGTRLPARPEEARGGLDRTSRAERRHAGSRYVRESEIGVDGTRGPAGLHRSDNGSHEGDRISCGCNGSFVECDGTHRSQSSET
ncbi:hypothetical protein HN011_002505 [Eciton burchellii]|nr:hypothetical protein HN011_002505 [Eciton burchellii]